MPVGLGGATSVLGRGVREIEGQFMYSAAWLDDRRPDIERLVLVAGHVVLLNPARPPGDPQPSD